MKNRLKEIRKSRGMTASDLSDCTNISRPSISNFENGIDEISAQRLYNIAQFFNVSIDYILMRTKTDLMHQNVAPTKIENYIQSNSYRSVLTNRVHKMIEALSEKDLTKLEKVINVMLEESKRMNEEYNRKENRNYGTK